MLKFIFYYDGKQDLDNHSYIHIKVILDVIKQFIGDDTLEYINGITIQGVKSEERKLVIEIWKTKQ
jgi:hypothetical protein